MEETEPKWNEVIAHVWGAFERTILYKEENRETEGDKNNKYLYIELNSLDIFRLFTAICLILTRRERSVCERRPTNSLCLFLRPFECIVSFLIHFSRLTCFGLRVCMYV